LAIGCWLLAGCALRGRTQDAPLQAWTLRTGQPRRGPFTEAPTSFNLKECSLIESQRIYLYYVNVAQITPRIRKKCPQKGYQSYSPLM
jgi:hypothetical protein